MPHNILEDAMDEAISRRFMETSGSFIAEEQSSEDQETLTIKGFASVEIPDRSRHIISPLEFNVDTFLNTGTLLENHEWIFEAGAKTSAGVVTNAVPSILRENPDNPEMFSVVDIRTGDKINEFPRASAVELSPDDRGLFIIADVIHKGTQKRIIDGRLKGLSWRGLVKAAEQVDGFLRLFGVDLFEISVTPEPVVNQSTFVVGKSTNSSEMQNISEFEVFKIRYPKSDFETASDVKKHAEFFNLDWQSLTETKDSFFIRLCDPRLIESRDTVQMPLGGVSAFLGPIKSATKSNSEESDQQTVEEESPKKENEVKMSDKQKFVSLPLDQVKERFPNLNLDVSKSVQTDDAELELYEVSSIDELDFSGGETSEKSESNSEASSDESSQEAKTAEPEANNSNMTKILEMIANLTDKMSNIDSRINSLETSKQTQETDTESSKETGSEGSSESEEDTEDSVDPDEFVMELAKSVEQLSSDKQSLEERLKEIEAKEQKSQKLLDSLKNLTPGQTQRSEANKVVSKSVEQENSEEDSLALFDDWFENMRG